MFSSKPNNEKLLRVFSSIRCLNKDQLPRYLEGRLTDVEKHLMEQHLTDCDLCFGALQALEQEGGYEKYQDLTGKLQRFIQDSIEPVSHVQKIAQYTKKEKTKESLLVYFWLAAFIGIGVCSIYVLRGHLRNQPPPGRVMAAANLPPKTDSVSTASVVQQPIVSADPGTGNKPATTTPAPNKPATPAAAAPAAKTTVTPPVHLSPADSIARAKAAALKAQQKKLAADSIRKQVALQKQQDSLKKEKEAAEKKEEKKPDPPPAPKQENKAPEPAKKETAAPAPVNSDDYLYKAAMVYQQQGNLSEAIERYKRIESNSSGKYVEMARYQLAICYRSKGQTGKARRMFKEVVRMDGSLKNSAQQALDSM